MESSDRCQRTSVWVWWTDLFSSVDDVLWVVESTGAGPPYDGVVAGRGVGDTHGRNLLHGLAQRYAAQQKTSSQHQHDHLKKCKLSIFFLPYL